MSTPSDDERPDPGEKEAEAGAGARAGAERAARFASPADEPPAVRQPVSFETVDVEEAVSIAKTAIEAAAAIVGIDAFPYVQLASHLVREIASGEAATGVHMKSVCEQTRTGRGHLPELYTEEWEVAGELSVRLITVAAQRSVHYEEIYSVPALISRDHNGLGTHHNTQATHAMHFLGLALGTADSLTTSYATPLLTGTRDDISAPSADMGRITAFAEDRCRSLPASWAGHVDELLRIRGLAINAVRTARHDLPRILRPLEIPPRDVAKGFSRMFLLRAMPFGPPTGRRRLSDDLLIPADDESVMSLFGRISERAVMFAGRPVGADGRVPTPEELARRGYRELPWDVGALGDLLGVARVPPWGVEYQWSRREQTLLRVQAGEGAWVRSWRLLRFLETELPAAMALAERSGEEWPIGCLARAYGACAPGKLKTADLRSQNAWRALLRVADTALVAADRRRRQRHALS